MRISFAFFLCAVLAIPPVAAQDQAKPDALLIYRDGRTLDDAGRSAEADALYLRAIDICNAELAENDKNLDSYTVKCWCLFRLERYQQVVDIGSKVLGMELSPGKKLFDPRIVEVMGEAYFYLKENALTLRFLQRYLDNVGEGHERVATAYFFMGETYLRMKRYNHADIAYSMAIQREPNMPRWWYRLGLVCEALGEVSRAYEAFARALKLQPSYADALTAQARVHP